MQLKDARVILTGAAGGIGSAIATALATAGCRLLLVDRNQQALSSLAESLGRHGVAANTLAVDLTLAEDRDRVAQQGQARLGGIDILINNAGLLDFAPFESEDPQLIERLIQVNVTAPLLLTRAVLPVMLARQQGRIVNMGSTFGSIGFPYFAAYSASKFALRGFSEALRRELEGSGIGVTFVAPRATRTALNTSAVNRMNAALKVNMDPPARVAAAVVEAIAADRKDVYVGFPESFFARLNAVLPRIVDQALRKQHDVMRSHATGTA